MKRWHTLPAWTRTICRRKRRISRATASLPTRSPTGQSRLKNAFLKRHRTYVDIHFCLAGEETISIASPQGSRETKAYSAENDTAYFDGASASWSVMRPGYFMVCFPHDIHRTGEADGIPGDVQKIVMKVKVV